MSTNSRFKNNDRWFACFEKSPEHRALLRKARRRAIKQMAKRFLRASKKAV